MVKMFYVYLQKKPNGDVFYVGKGSGKRAWSADKRNRHWHSVVKKHGGFEVEIVFKSPLEDLVFAEERRIISKLRQYYKLVNKSDGGKGGTSGWVPTEENRANMSKAQTGKKHTLEVRQKMSESKAGIAFWPKGKKRPPEFGQHLSLVKKGVKHSSEHVENNRKAHTGKKHKPETIIKMQELRKGGTHNSRSISVCGVTFQSMRSFALHVGVTTLCVKKWVDAGKTHKLEEAYNGKAA